MKAWHYFGALSRPYRAVSLWEARYPGLHPGLSHGGLTARTPGGSGIVKMVTEALLQAAKWLAYGPAGRVLRAESLDGLKALNVIARAGGPGLELQKYPAL